MITRSGIALSLVLGTAVMADDNEVIFYDTVGDGVVRRTDPGNDGPINAAAVLPDIVDVRLAAWAPTNPLTNPYAGNLIDPDNAHIFRIVLTIQGLVNPPGEIDIGENPFQFGPSPVYAFIDLDVDDQKNSGGELCEPAKQRYLANVARFGGKPEGSYGERAVLDFDEDVDCNFESDPQFERTGADFAFVLCGCWPVTIVSKSGGDGDDLFEAGETWVVRGRFLERAKGFQEASGMIGGTQIGLYDPISNVQFKHDISSDTTTITYVGALDMIGASMLTGEPVQEPDTKIDIDGSHSSLYEALLDLIAGANGNYSDPVDEFIKPWQGKDAEDYLDPTGWYTTAIVATSYTSFQNDAVCQYVWTDIGFQCTTGDFDGSGAVNSLDSDLFCLTTGGDVIDLGSGFARSFSVFDLNYDGMLDASDVACDSCLADFNGDGLLNILDFVAFQSAFVGGDPSADVNGDGQLNILDFVAFQSLFQVGC